MEEVVQVTINGWVVFFKPSQPSNGSFPLLVSGVLLNIDPDFIKPNSNVFANKAKH